MSAIRPGAAERRRVSTEECGSLSFVGRVSQEKSYETCGAGRRLAMIAHRQIESVHADGLRACADCRCARQTQPYGNVLRFKMVLTPRMTCGNVRMLENLIWFDLDFVYSGP